MKSKKSIIQNFKAQVSTFTQEQKQAWYKNYSHLVSEVNDTVFSTKGQYRKAINNAYFQSIVDFNNSNTTVNENAI